MRRLFIVLGYRPCGESIAVRILRQVLWQLPPPVVRCLALGCDPRLGEPRLSSGYTSSSAPDRARAVSRGVARGRSDLSRRMKTGQSIRSVKKKKTNPP